MLQHNPERSVIFRWNTNLKVSAVYYIQYIYMYQGDPWYTREVKEHGDHSLLTHTLHSVQKKDQLPERPNY